MVFNQTYYIIIQITSLPFSNFRHSPNTDLLVSKRFIQLLLQCRICQTIVVDSNFLVRVSFSKALRMLYLARILGLRIQKKSFRKTATRYCWRTSVFFFWI